MNPGVFLASGVVLTLLVIFLWWWITEGRHEDK